MKPSQTYYSEVIKTQIKQPHAKRNIVVVLLLFILVFLFGYFYIANNDLMIFRTALIKEALRLNINPYQVDKSTVEDLLKQYYWIQDFGEYHIDQAAFQYLIDIPLTIFSNIKVRSGIWMLTLSIIISYIFWDVVIKQKRNQKLNIFGFLSILIFLFISLTNGQQYSGVSLLLLTCILKLNESLEHKTNVVAGISVGLMVLFAHDWAAFLAFASAFIALNKEYKVILWTVLTILIIILVTQLVFPRWSTDFLNITIGKYKAVINLWFNSIKTLDFTVLQLILKALLLSFLIITLISSNSTDKYSSFSWGISLAVCILVLISDQPFRYIPLLLFPMINLIDSLFSQFPHNLNKINIGVCVVSTFFLFIHMSSIGINRNVNSSLQILFLILTLVLFILLYWFKPINKSNRL